MMASLRYVNRSVDQSIKLYVQFYLFKLLTIVAQIGKVIYE